MIKLLKSKRGSSSVLIILILLSLSMFGVLSMMSAHADLNLARKSGQWTQTWYKLDSDGNKELSVIGSILRGLPDSDSYLSDASVALIAQGYNAYFNPDGSLDIELTLYSTPEDTQSGEIIISDKNNNRGQYLHMKLRVNPEPVSGTECQILAWQQRQEPFEYGGYGENIWSGE